MTGTFGPDTGGWGDGDTDDESPPSGDLGGGHSIEIDEDAWKAILHSPEVWAAVTARAQEVCDTANSLVAMDPRTVERLSHGEPAYEIHPSEVADTTRARVQVQPANMLGIVDDAVNSTLLKSMGADGGEEL